MSFRPEEVSAILAQELERYEAKLETKSVGSVLSVGDGIARLWGLEDAMAGELIKFPGDVMGMVLNLKRTTSARYCSAPTRTSRKVTAARGPGAPRAGRWAGR